MNDAHCDVRLSAHEPVRYERFTTAEADAIADLRGSPVLHGLEAQVAVVIGHDRAEDRQAEARSRDGRMAAGAARCSRSGAKSSSNVPMSGPVRNRPASASGRI